MSNKVQTILLAVAFAGAAQTALACTTCTPSGTTINLGNENNNALTANPSASATGGSSTVTNNPNITGSVTGSNTLNANPTNTLTSNPTLTANPTATSNSSGIGYGGNATGGNATSSSTAQGGTAYGGTSSAYVGNVAGGSAQVGVAVGNDNNVTATNSATVGNVSTGASTSSVGNTTATVGNTTATTGASTSSAKVEQGAVSSQNSYSSNTTYKAAASTAYAGSVAGQGHGCFQHEGGWGAGVQVIAAGVSGNYNKGETYNKDCVADQAALAMIVKTGNPVSDALAAETAAKMAPNTVGEAIKAVPTSPLLGLFATYGAAPAQNNAYASPAAQVIPVEVRVQPVVNEPTCSKGTWNAQLGKCSGGLIPAVK